MRLTLSLLALLLAVPQAPAGELPPANAEAIRAHVAFLADDLTRGEPMTYGLEARFNF